MAFTASLRSCWTKLSRARSHRESLVAQITGHFSVPSNRPTLIAELDSADACHIFRVASVPPIAHLQETVAVMIGDAVHNLRSALDHLVFQLASVSTNGQLRYPQRVQFPIGNTATQYATQQQNYLSEVNQVYQSVIDSYQPYQGIAGRPDSWSGPYIHQLSLLQHLSNWDKHRLLNTVLIIPGGAEFAFPPGIALAMPALRSLSVDGMLRTSPFRNAGERLGVGVEVCRGRLLGPNVPATIPDVGYVIPHIALEEKRPVAPTLERLERFVETILSDFQARLTSP